MEPGNSAGDFKVDGMIDGGLLRLNERQVPAIYNRGTLRRTKSPHYVDKSNMQTTSHNATQDVIPALIRPESQFYSCSMPVLSGNTSSAVSYDAGWLIACLSRLFYLSRGLSFRGPVSTPAPTSLHRLNELFSFRSTHNTAKNTPR